MNTYMGRTPAEILADIVQEALGERGDGLIDQVLVPEQCFLVYINGKTYHVTVEEFHEA